MYLDDNIVIDRSWLYADSLTFDPKFVLEKSLYYPASGTDGDMVKFFSDKVASFVHVDYRIEKQQLLDDLNKNPFKGFRIVHSESIDPEKLVPNSWNFRPGSPQLSYVEKIIPFCEWIVFENEEKKRFSLLHICAEGIQTFDDLYNRLNFWPYAIVIKGSDGFSGNWTTFLRPDRMGKFPLLEKLQLNKNGLPKYLITHLSNPDWTYYNKEIDYIEVTYEYRLDAYRSLSIFGHK